MGLSFLLEQWGMTFAQRYTQVSSFLFRISPLVFYSVLYALFEKWLWSCPLFRVFGMELPPDLRGRWKVSNGTTYNGSEQQGAIEIEQTFSSMKIRGYFLKSDSESTMTKLILENAEWKLKYQYINRPRYNADPGMQLHEGTAEHIFFSARKCLRGGYYNSLKNSGNMSLEFESKVLSHEM